MHDMYVKLYGGMYSTFTLWVTVATTKQKVKTFYFSLKLHTYVCM